MESIVPLSTPITDARGSYCFVSLGCPKNLVDSERMLGLLTVEGYLPQAEPEGADVVIINTCGFIEEARKESLSVIHKMIDLKHRGETKAVVVSGCLAERQREALFEEVPDIDAIVGVFGREEITKVCDRLLGGMQEQRALFRPAPIRAFEDGARLRLTPPHYAYLKISEGCDRTCTFCAIPAMRGRHVTKPIEQVVAEAEELSSDGVRELILVAQDTTYYGLDLYGEVRLTELLGALNAVSGIDWIRVMYAYPIHFSDELIGVLGDCDKVVPYIDMPLQHVNDVVLRRMQRRVKRHEIETLVHKLRSRIADLVLRTTFIVGFPGETDAQFRELVDFVHDVRFERLGCFTYSFEPGTPATRLDGHLDEQVKQQRQETLMTTQQHHAFEWNRKMVGRRVEVIIDAPSDNPDHAWVGRTWADAPEIDGAVLVRGDGIQTGDIVSVEIQQADNYDLRGTLAAFDSTVNNEKGNV